MYHWVLITDGADCVRVKFSSKLIPTYVTYFHKDPSVSSSSERGSLDAFQIKASEYFAKLEAQFVFVMYQKIQNILFLKDRLFSSMKNIVSTKTL